MPSLEVVQSNIGNSKVMNLTNSCHTSSLALYLWRVVSPLGSKSLKRRSLKHGCIFAEGRELYELKRYGRFTCCVSFSIFCSIILDAALLVQVPFARSSLNHDDVFVLDTENKIYQFNGANSNIQERAKALEVIQYLKEKYHGGVCDVAIVGEGHINFRLSNLLAIFCYTYGLVYFLYQMMGSYKQSRTLVNSGSFLEVLHQ
jgi:hypothetical protein